MRPIVRKFESEALDKALHHNLRQRIEVVARYDANTFGTLKTWELALLLQFGIALPLALAWWTL